MTGDPQTLGRVQVPTLLFPKDRGGGHVVAVLLKRDITDAPFSAPVSHIGRGSSGMRMGSWALPHLVQSGLSQINRVFPKQHMEQ